MPTNVSLQTPGDSTDDNVTTPDSADFDPTADFWVAASITPDDWSSGQNQFIIQRRNGTDPAGWSIHLTNTGAFSIRWGDGAFIIGAQTDNLGFVNKSRHALGVHLDVDDGAGNRVVTFYESLDDGATWEQFEQFTNAGTATIAATSGPVRIANSTVANEEFTGRIHWVEVRNGDQFGPLIADVDFNAQTVGATSFTDPQGHLWTLNGDTELVAVSSFPDDRLLDAIIELGLERVASHVDFSGIGGNEVIRTQHQTKFTPDADLFLAASVAPDQWVGGPALGQVLIDNFGGTTGGYRFELQTDGTLDFRWGDGAASHTLSTTAILSFNPGERAAVAVWLDVDDGVGGHVATFYTSDDDGVSWQVFDTVADAGTTTIADAGDDLQVGSRDTSESDPLIGKIFWAEMRNGDQAGPVVTRPDLTVSPPPFNLFSDAHGVAWDIDGTFIDTSDDAAFIIWTPVASFPAEDQDDNLQRARILDQQLRVTKGRRRVTDQPGPQTVNFTLDNVDSVFSTGRTDSPLWPNLELGIPVRIRAEWEDDGFTPVRFEGEITDFQYGWADGDLRWTADGGEARVTIQAEGILARLEGTDTQALSAIGAEVRFWHHSPILGVEVQGYWPLETSAAEAFMGPSGNLVSGEYAFGSGVSIPGDVGLARSTTDDTRMDFTPRPRRQPWIDDDGFGFDNRFKVETRVLIAMPESPGVLHEFFRLHTPDFQVILRVTQFDDLSLQVREPDGNLIGLATEAIPSSFFTNILLELVVTVRNGASPQLFVNFGSISISETIPNIDQLVDVNRVELKGLSGWTFGELTISNNTTSTSTSSAEVWTLGSFEDCTPLTGLSLLDDFTLIIQGTSDMLITQRGLETDIQYAQRIAVTEGGLLSETRDNDGFKLKYRTREDLINQAPFLELNARRDQLANPYTPGKSIRDVVNTVTAALTDDTEVTVENADSIRRIGAYRDTLPQRYCSQVDALQAAGWLVNLGTWPDVRASSLIADLGVLNRDNPHLPIIDPARLFVFDDGIEEGDTIWISNLPVQHPDQTDLIKLMAQGWTEVLAPFTWRLQFNTTVGEPWSVGILDDNIPGFFGVTPGTNGQGRRLDAETTLLISALDTVATVFNVDAQTEGWITDTSPLSSQLPVDIQVMEETMTATSITGPFPDPGTYTFTVTRSNPRAHAAGTPVHVAYPLRLG